MNPTEKQIGGTHYKTAIQPVQYIHANGLNFFEGNVIKYITRHRNKGGKADLEKAIHYIEMLMEFEYPENQENQAEKTRPMIVEGGVLFESITYPLNTDSYVTEPESAKNSCKGCIFDKKTFCIIEGTQLNHECFNKKIIYTSLKQ